MEPTTYNWTWMMWLEDDPKDAPEKTLAKAIQYYTKKYKCAPTHARVPLSWPDLNGKTPPGLQIERSRGIMPRHIHLAADPEAVKAALTAAVETIDAAMPQPEAAPLDFFNLAQPEQDGAPCQNS